MLLCLCRCGLVYSLLYIISLYILKINNLQFERGESGFAVKIHEDLSAVRQQCLTEGTRVHVKIKHFAHTHIRK